jgi:RNA recognition motif-containing protein
MEAKLYVGNMPYDTTEDELRAMFSQAGTVQSVDIIKDRDTGRPKGFAFITMETQAEAEKAINLFNNKPINDRALTVNMARPREERPNRGGGGGGGSWNNSSSNRGRSSGGGSGRRY